MESSDNRAPKDRDADVVLRMPTAIPDIIPERWFCVLFSRDQSNIGYTWRLKYVCVPHRPAQQVQSSFSQAVITHPCAWHYLCQATRAPEVDNTILPVPVHSTLPVHCRYIPGTR